MSLKLINFPFRIRAADHELLIFHACLCVDAFPPHAAQLVIVCGPPGPLRPELVVVPGSREHMAGWLLKHAKIPYDDVQKIFDAADAREAECQELMRRRHEENFHQLTEGNKT